MHTATGTFDVKILPPSAPPVPGDFVRLSIDKNFQGGMQGTSKVEMLHPTAATSLRAATSRWSGSRERCKASLAVSSCSTTG